MMDKERLLRPTQRADLAEKNYLSNKLAQPEVSIKTCSLLQFYMCCSKALTVRPLFVWLITVGECIAYESFEYRHGEG
jgi:hypothetical protein